MAKTAQFRGELLTVYDPEASRLLEDHYWRVVFPLSFHLGDADDTQVHIPAGYLTDGASVPRVLWASVPPWGPYGPAVVVHDQLCDSWTIWKRGALVDIDREEVDRMLEEAMLALDVDSYTRRKIMLGVNGYRVTTHPQHRTSSLKQQLEHDWPASPLAQRIARSTQALLPA